jgi:uncharacterized protein
MDQGFIILTLLSFLTGLVAGYLSGLLGIGSGVLMVPAAMFILEMDFPEAKALSLFVIMFISPIGMWRHHTHGNLHPRTGLYLGIPGVCGSLLGVAIAGLIDVIYLKALFALILFFAAYRMITGNRPSPGSPATGSGKGTKAQNSSDRDSPVQAPSSTNTVEEAFLTRKRSLPLVGFVGGFSAGLLGIGGGIIMVPSMVFLSYPIHSAVANSLMVVFLNAGSATIANAIWGEIEIVRALPMMIGAVLSINKGADMSVTIDRDRLRTYFGYFMILIGCYMLYRTWIG